VADNRNLVLQLLITAKDDASAAFGKLFGYLDDNTKVIAGKIREAFSGLFGGGVSGAIEFEAQLDRVAAKGGYTAQEMAALSGEIRQIGATFGISGTEAAQGMEALAAAGLNATDAIKTLPSVLALASSEQISADAAATKLIDSLSVMGLGFGEAGRMADVLAKGANITTSSASQLAEALSEAGGTARAAGMDLESTVAALDLLHKNGIKGSEAGTALKAILTALLDPSSKASQELTKLGITSRDLGTVLGALQAKGGEASTAILAFGTEAGPGLRALIGEGQTGLEAYTGQLKNADGAASDAAAQMGGNLKMALASLNSAWESLKATLVEPLLEPIARTVRDLAAAFQDTLKDGSIKGVQDLLREFGTGIADSIRKAVDSFDFKGAVQSVNDFAQRAKGSFDGVIAVAQASAGSISVAWNLITAPINALVGSYFKTVSNLYALLAGIEEQASKVGLGTLERAAQLRAKADAALATAADLAKQTEQDVQDLADGAQKTGTAFDGVTAAMQRAREEAEKAKPPDLGNAQNLEPIRKSLEDYAGMLERAQVAQQTAAAAADEAQHAYLEIGQLYDQGKVSLYAYEEAKRKDAAAQAASKIATENLSQAERDYHVAKLKATQAVIDGTDKEQISQAALVQSKKQVYDAAQLAIEQAGKEGSATLKVAEAQAQTAAGELRLAQAKGDTQKIAEAALGVAQRELAVAQERRAQQALEQQAYQLASQRIAELTAHKGKLTEEDQKELAALKEKYPQIASLIAQQAEELRQTDLDIEKKRLLAEHARILAGPVGELTRLYQEQAKEHQRAADASERYHDAQVTEAEGALKLAEISGDEVAQLKAANAVRDARIAQAQNIAAIRAQEAADTEKAISAKVLEMAADGEWTKTDQEAEDQLRATLAAKQDAAVAAQNHADQLRAEAKASEEAAAAAKENEEADKKEAEAAAERKAMADAYNQVLAQWHHRLKALSPAAAEAFNAHIMGARAATEETDSLTAAISKNMDEMARVPGSVLAQGFIGWASQVGAAALEVEQAFLTQKQGVESAIDSLNRFVEEGGNVAEIQRIMTANSGDLEAKFNLLDDQDLSNLRSAIEAANNKLREMQQETADARQELGELNAELLEAQGADQKAALLREQLDYQERLARIEKQRAEAEAMGNRELLGILNDQQAVLEKIHATKLANIQADAEANDSTRRTATTLRELADSAERAHTATRNLASTDLSGLVKSAEQAKANFEAIRGLM